MRNSLLIFGVFAALVCFEKPAAAQNNPWCAYYDLGEGGATNCGFATSQQCLATVSGIGGSCGPNPMYQSVPKAYPLTRHPRRYSYWRTTLSRKTPAAWQCLSLTQSGRPN